MSDPLSQAKHRLAIGLDRESPVVEPLNADQWVVKSLLQKSIRRGEFEVAQRAALTFLEQKGSALWRRFIVIAFEDIGAGSADVVAMTVAASTDLSWRKKSGGDAVVAFHLARLLAEAPKSRSAEHLITSSDQHPSLDTRVGQEAIRSLVKYNSAIREFLERHVAPAQRHKAAYMAAFYADAAPLASKLSWDGADRLEALGTETDLLKVGVPAEQIEPLLQLFRANIPHLNKLRVHTVCKKRGLVDIATAIMAEGEV